MIDTTYAVCALAEICEMGCAGCEYPIEAEETAAWQKLEIPGNLE
jgi:hypothetical protein